MVFLMKILGNPIDPPLSRKSYRKKAKSVVSFTNEQTIICSQTQLDDNAYGQTIICRQLFKGQVVGSLPTKRKKHSHRMLKLLFSRES